MSRFLTILEVSQKQAYIFASNKVKDNIVNSAIIAKVLSPEYLATVGEEHYGSDNLVYSGGGHTILEFTDKEKAKQFVSKLTLHVIKNYDGLEIFAKIMEYDETLSPKENLKKLSGLLEGKKALRCASFHQGTFGIERIDSDTRKPKAKGTSDSIEAVRKEEYNEAAKKFTPEGFEPAYRFDDLGGDKGNSNFIAVVHIDGNGMGKRVDELYELDGMQDWNSAKQKLQLFSDGIDVDFKSAYSEMAETVGSSLKSGSLKGKLNLEKSYFPIRRIITAGDDICFVTEGRIGLECARIFIEKLSAKKNSVDWKGYSACAGVAIVHRKYPFYKAYELAEMLCSSAKKQGAALSPEDDGRSVSAIDWHIEFGEIKDSLAEIKAVYNCSDGNLMTQRPYTIQASEPVMKKANPYGDFVRKVKKLTTAEKELGNGKIKNLRAAIKEGETETTNYLKFNKMEKFISTPFVQTEVGTKVCTWFDAVEMMDTFLVVTEEA